MFYDALFIFITPNGLYGSSFKTEVYSAFCLFDLIL